MGVSCTYTRTRTHYKYVPNRTRDADNGAFWSLDTEELRHFDEHLYERSADAVSVSQASI